MTAERAEKALRDILKTTPEGSDRRLVASLVEAAAAYNEVARAQVDVNSPEKSRDLVQETYDLLGTLREPTTKERKAFQEKGYVFVAVEAKSLGQVYSENPEYFDYVNPSVNLRAYSPRQDFVIAIKAPIPRSNNASHPRQLRMIEDYSQTEIESVVPDVKAIMLPATGYAQADIKFQKANDGKKLIPDFYARALDTTVGSHVADVGRARPDRRLRVVGWYRVSGGGDVWALPAVVFLRK